MPFLWNPPGTYSGSLSWLDLTSRWGNPKSGCSISESVTGECMLNGGPAGIMAKSVSDPANHVLD